MSESQSGGAVFDTNTASCSLCMLWCTLMCANVCLDCTRHVPGFHRVSLCWQMLLHLYNSNAVFYRVSPILLEERAKNLFTLNRHYLG